MPQAKLELAFSFIAAHPEEAADTLERHPPRAVADFMSDMPHTLAALVLERTLPQYAAKLLEWMPERAPALLTPMHTRSIVAILRYLGPGERDAALSHLPADKTARCRLLLSYTLDTVGAWMVPQIAMLPETTPLEDALARLSRETAALDSDAVYIIDRQTQLRGIVSLPALLRAREKGVEHTAIGDVMQRHPQTVASRATLASIQHHEGWNQSDTLPVLNRRRKLIGMLRHVDMRKGLDHIAGHADSGAPNSHAIADLYHTYSRVLLALCDVAGDMTGAGQSSADT